MADELADLKVQLSALAKQRDKWPRIVSETNADFARWQDEVNDVQSRIAALESGTRADPELLNPNLLLENADMIEGAAQDTNSPLGRLRWEAGAPARAKAAEDTKAKHEDWLNSLGPARRALEEENAETKYSDEEYAVKLQDANAKDGMTSAALDETKRQGCTSPKLGAGIGIGIAIIVAVIAVVLQSSDSSKKAGSTKQQPGAAAPAPSAGAIVYTGSSGVPVGCVPCDGKARFIPIQSPPGPGSFPGAEGKAQAETELGPGTLQNLRVEISGADRGRWTASLQGASLGCVLQPGATSCVAEGPYELTAATLVSLIVGNDGDPKIYGNPNGQLNPNGSPVPLVHPESDGAFTMTFTFEYIPAS